MTTRHPEAHEQRVKGVSRTRLLRVRKAEGSPKIRQYSSGMRPQNDVIFKID